MARLSQVAYLSHDDGRPDEEAILANLQAEDPRFMSVTGASKNSAQAILVEHIHYFVLAFRGTDQKADWVDNLNLGVKETDFGKFHRGFLGSLDDVWPSLWAKYQELRKINLGQIDEAGPSRRRPLFLTGHSLGGAMATVAAARLLDLDHPFISCYTFGQPRAVDRKTRIAFDIVAKDRFFRFQNNSDIVSRVPARALGYSHVGECIYISEEGEIHRDPGFWFRFLDTIDGAIESAKKLQLDVIIDHKMDNYLAAIRDWQVKF
ncbi:MAG: lipase family protein [Synechococcus sp.]